MQRNALEMAATDILAINSYDCLIQILYLFVLLNLQTPGTPNTPSTPKGRVLRSNSTQLAEENILRECGSPLKLSNTPRTPVQRGISTSSTPKTKDNLVFRTPMTFKPRIVGNRPVPSPSREEIWKQELGLEGERNQIMLYKI